MLGRAEAPRAGRSSRSSWKLEPLRVAVQWAQCDGPGEAREAGLGVASGNGKGARSVRGQVVRTVPESKIVATLIDEAMMIAEQMDETRAAVGRPARKHGF
ncbi:4-hydroxy-3-methylbut-2-en-1-yl diphosphate synthase (flavodoxin) OS=Streptomyces fumanus OX=67302 GN=ispG1 PE=3 SV=1 [Streptomyces fumanus]